MNESWLTDAQFAKMEPLFRARCMASSALMTVGRSSGLVPVPKSSGRAGRTHDQDPCAHPPVPPPAGAPLTTGLIPDHPGAASCSPTKAIERMFGCINNLPPHATRYDWLATNNLAAVGIAATVINMGYESGA